MIRLVVSYEDARDLDQLKALVGPAIIKDWVSKTQKGPYKKAYIHLKTPLTNGGKP